MKYLAMIADFNLWCYSGTSKGHLRTEGIVPYLEVVPYWEVFQKK